MTSLITSQQSAPRLEEIHFLQQTKPETKKLEDLNWKTVLSFQTDET